MSNDNRNVGNCFGNLEISLAATDSHIYALLKRVSNNLNETAEIYL